MQQDFDNKLTSTIERVMMVKLFQNHGRAALDDVRVVAPKQALADDALGFMTTKLIARGLVRMVGTDEIELTARGRDEVVRFIKSKK